MLKIEADIRHDALEGLRSALAREGLPSLSVGETYGWDVVRGRRVVRPRLRLEMVVQREDVERAVDLVIEYARTGREGDGMIALLPVADAVRVRTTQRGREVVVSHTGIPDTLSP
ncbi:MAG: P-II family nitrogen regulator [Thermoleophilia bacterium]|nr:P-II family nitrogen regulator [Thermoleophilia bacterium]